MYAIQINDCLLKDLITGQVLYYPSLKNAQDALRHHKLAHIDCPRLFKPGVLDVIHVF